MNNENLRQCVFCEEYHDEENGVYIDSGEDFCCDDCKNEQLFYCEKCGEYHDINNNEMYEIYNNNYEVDYLVCSKWVEYYYYCNKCDRYFKDSDKMINLNNDETCYCERCFEDSDHYFCDICEEYYTPDYIAPVYYNHNCNCACENCAGDYVRYCDNCDNAFNENDMEWTDDDLCLCPTCYEQRNNDTKNKRLSYHGFSNWQKHYGADENENNTKRFYGVELEIDTQEDYTTEKVNEICKKINNKINSICEGDGSLNRQTGIEIITHPSTLKYYYEHYDDFNDTFKMLIDNGYLSHDLTQCGLHIHCTRPSDDVIDKILVVMEHYKSEILKFSRRVNSQMHYCKFLSDYNNNKDSEFFKALYYIKKDTTKNIDRYMALNLTNSKTIEFRIFRGTLNTNTFYSCLEFVKNIVELCENENDLSKITWERLTKGRYISKYIKEKDIFTNKIIYDNSRLIEIRETRENKIKDKIINFTKKCIIKEFNKIKNINNIDNKCTLNDVWDIANTKIRELNNTTNFIDYTNRIFDHKDDYNLDTFIEKLTYNFGYLNKTQTKDIREYIKKITNKGVN